MGNAASSEWQGKALYVAWKLAVYELCHFYPLEEHWALGNLLDTGLAQELASFVFLFSCLRPGSERFPLLWAVWSISTAWLYCWAQTQPLGVCELHGWPVGCSLLTPGVDVKDRICFCHFVLLHCPIILHCFPCCGFICLHTRIFLFPFQVTEIRLKYFDTVPVAAAMCVLKTGFLFVASEFGNQWVVLLLSRFTLATIKVGEREVVSGPCSFSWECFMAFRTKVLPSSLLCSFPWWLSLF